MVSHQSPSFTVYVRVQSAAKAAGKQTDEKGSPNRTLGKGTRTAGEEGDSNESCDDRAGEHGF